MVDFVGMAVIGICVLITCCCLLCGRPGGDNNLPKTTNEGKICSFWLFQSSDKPVLF